MSEATARAANELKSNLFPDWTLTEVLSDTDYLDDTPEAYQPVNAELMPTPERQALNVWMATFYGIE